MERVGFCLFVFLLTLTVSEATMCYLCVSTHHFICETTNCTTDQCMRIQDDDLIVRTCALEGSEDGCDEEHGVMVCICTGELCNDATVKVAPMTTLALGVFINIVFRFM